MNLKTKHEENKEMGISGTPDLVDWELRLPANVKTSNISLNSSYPLWQIRFPKSQSGSCFPLTKIFNDSILEQEKKKKVYIP